MNTTKYGFVYLWFDKKHKRFYVGCHWGTEDDGYVCSSDWMRRSYNRRQQDFKRRIIKTNISSRIELYKEEQRYLCMIKESEIKPKNNRPRYYNLCLSSKNAWHKYPDKIKEIGQKISSSKKGKQIEFKDPVERAKKISEGKKLAFEKRKQELGYKVAPEIVEKMVEARKDIIRSPISNKKTSDTLKAKYNNEWKHRRREPKPKMPRLEQDKQASVRLKSKWADPVWAENQRKKLSEASKRRYAK